MSGEEELLGVPSEEESGAPLFDPRALGARRKGGGMRWSFRVPAKVGVPGRDPGTFVLRELSPADIVTARSVAEKAASKMGPDLVAATMALVVVDGREVNHAEGEGERFAGGWSPKVRALLLLAFRATHTTTEAEDEAFLSSMAAES